MATTSTSNAQQEEIISGKRLLSACARHDLPGTKALLKLSSAKIRDANTGFTPLHAAIASYRLQSRGADSTDARAIASLVSADQAERDAWVEKLAASAAADGDGKGKGNGDESAEDVLCEIVRVLFENGAIWNDLDVNAETPGCIAWRVGARRAYELVVDAGVRAELLLSRLGELGWDGGDDAEEDEEEVLVEGNEEGGKDANDAVVVDEKTVHDEVTSATATENSSGPAKTGEEEENYIDHWDSNAAFLRSSLRFTDTQLLDSSSNAVMMDWEDALMRRHAATLLPTPGLRAMNIGHGMGIVDTAIQTHSPAEHHIVEAHPAVLAQLKKNGWLEKPGVRVHEGRWQDVLPKLLAEGVELDAVYYDTFAESYGDLKELFEEYVTGLLSQNGRFGFYHGLGADRRVCYDVYTKVCF
jgi:type IV protein arginine methyltransferase